MIAQFYYDIYLCGVTLSTLIVLSHIRSVRNLREISRSNPLGLLLIVFFLAVFIGLRPLSYVFVDMMNYNTDYYAFFYGQPWVLDLSAGNYIFDNLFAWLGSMQLDISCLFLIMASLYFGGMAWACYKSFNSQAILAFLVCLAAFSTFSYGTNGIKAGVAGSFFLLALAYRKQKALALFFLVCSLGFHHSMVMPIVAYIMAWGYKNSKMYFLGWCMAFLMAAGHVTFFQNLFAGMSDESGADYLKSNGTDWGGKTGFRIDFIIYSAMPILIGYWAIFKKKVKSESYQFILNVYLTTNAVWMLCMYANFNNRIAYLSWFMYPIVLIYPLLKMPISSRQHLILKRVVLGHLGFTLFMTYIYY